MNEHEADSGQSEKDSSQMTEEELRAQLEKHFREQKVDEVLVQFLVSLSNLAYVKMGLTEDTEDIRDLAQASLAIDAFAALLDAAGKKLPDQDASALAGALASLRMTFVKISASEVAESEPAAPEPESGKPDDDPSSRLWVPGKD